MENTMVMAHPQVISFKELSRLSKISETSLIILQPPVSISKDLTKLITV